ncbi:MAG: OmpH family outer membrane protein [Chlorobiota bacterium]|nr:OmpH family outer membrane protein [Chlorobiota bacterium]QQS67369.1 MAG: OmpH family outer membrane protein [Chlorobiota bacterium]
MPIASAQKLGYVSSAALMDKFPEAKTALGKLSEFQINWLNDIENQEKSIRIQKDSIFNNRLLWSSQERKDADSKLSELISKLSSFRLGKFGENGEYEKKQLEIMNPVLDKISKAIEDEAKSQKMDFIFDKSNRTLPMLYSNPNNDISVLVLKRLGVDISKDSLNSNQKDSQKDVMNARGKGRDENPQQNQVPKFDPNDLLNGIKPDAPAKEVVKPNK